jgi:diguanylate cyclase (GGDEF)-like protein
MVWENITQEKQFLSFAELLQQARALRNQDPAKALGFAEEALEHAKTLAETEAVANCLYQCAELHHDLSCFDLSLSYARQALEHFEHLGDALQIVDTLETLGKTYEKLGQYAEAFRHHDRALQLSREQGDQRRAGGVLLSLGVLRYNQGDYLGAIGYYLESFGIVQELKDEVRQGKALGNIGNAYERMGDHAKALEYHFQSLRCFGSDECRLEQSFVLNNIANVYVALEDFHAAIYYHQESLNLKQSLDNKWGEGVSLQNLGSCYLHLHALDKAESYLQKSLLIAKEVDDKEGQAICLNELGTIALKRSAFQKAHSYYQGSLVISESLGDRYNQIQSRLNLAKVQRYVDLSAALASASTALKLAQETKTKRFIVQAHEVLADLYEEQGDFFQTSFHLREHHRLEREVFSEQSQQKLQSLRLQFGLEQAEKEKEIYRLKHVELAKAYEALTALNASLQKANKQKEKLLKTLAKQKKLLEHQSTHDALTGLYNRRYFDKEMLQAYRRALRYNHPLSLVIADIDNFKKINDRFSHQVGDEVLKTIAKLLLRNSRETDVIARYGGEEFALLLTNTSGEDALKVCEKVRRLVEHYAWHKIHPNLTVTLSMGLFDDTKVGAVEEMMNQADKRLYKAKHHGKNQVVAG